MNGTACEALPPVCRRPLRAAEVTAINAGRRLYRTELIAAEATVTTVLCHTSDLDAAERAALALIGERDFGICARAGVFYQQAADLLADLHEPYGATGGTR
jgi:hypothetical protein